MLDLLLLYAVAHKKAIQLINQCFYAFNFWFFNRLIVKRKFFKIIYSTNIINIRDYCRFYTLQMINLGSIINENKKHNEKWPYVPDHPYRILIIGGSRSGKTNTLINLINEQEDIDKI